MKIKDLLSKIIIPGFQGQSLYEVSMFFYKDFWKAQLQQGHQL